jgi:hypothetical protein
VVTSTRAGWFVGNGVAAREKLRTPAAKKRKADQDQRAADDPVDRVDAWHGERRGQQAIQGETIQNSGRKEQDRSPDDGCRSGAVHLFSNRVRTHALLPENAGGDEARVAQKRQPWCHSKKLTTRVSIGEIGTDKGNGSDGGGTTQDGARPNR